VPHTATTVLSATCLQFKPFGPPMPFRASSRLGQAGLSFLANWAAARVRRVGRYRLNAVTER
jgi:hypothetical protein